ncbi:hypothetical protein RND81_09G055500 [Saponaria officinalis]|uniref:Uncharacterized protein n=1 Tax=Saponaria officinalis TaxID=3572 RepID=A0AAW1IJ24_SAPOF
MSMEKKAHVRDLVSMRTFMREIIKEVGPASVQSAMTRASPGYHGNHVLVDIFEEEYNLLNWGKFELDKMYWRRVDEDLEMIATPKVDKCIVREEEEEEEEEVVIVKVVSAPPKESRVVSPSPSITTPENRPPKMSKKRFGRTRPGRETSKRLRFDKCVGCSH